MHDCQIWSGLDLVYRSYSGKIVISDPQSPIVGRKPVYGYEPTILTKAFENDFTVGVLYKHSYLLTALVRISY